MLKKKQIYKFLDLFTINDDKTNDLIEKNNYSSISKLIKLKNPILKRFGVYFIFDKRVIQKKNNKFLKHLIYIGSAGGNIKKNKFIKPDSGESFFLLDGKHTIGRALTTSHSVLERRGGLRGAAEDEMDALQ